MNIKGFRIKNQKIQKLWIIVSLAIIMAIVLIFLAFFIIFKTSEEVEYTSNLFECDSYYTSYTVTTYSNKNQNTYNMEEYYKKDDNNANFRFNTKNENNNYSYIIKNNLFTIKSDEQINKYENYLNEELNLNILSFSTFSDLYKNSSNIESKNQYIKINIEEKNEYIVYTILFDKNIISNNSENYLEKYIKKLVDDMKISKLQLIVENKTNIPKEYIVYTEGDKAYIDMVYNEFKINAKFDEKVFSF